MNVYSLGFVHYVLWLGRENFHTPRSSCLRVCTAVFDRKVILLFVFVFAHLLLQYLHLIVFRPPCGG